MFYYENWEVIRPILGINGKRNLNRLTKVLSLLFVIVATPHLAENVVKTQIKC